MKMEINIHQMNSAREEFKFFHKFSSQVLKLTSLAPSTKKNRNTDGL